MASTIITKNSSTASAVPVVGDLTKGELAVNVTDKKIYTKDNSAAVVKLVGSLGNQEANAVAITGGSIAGITDLAVADGGTGASTASDARTNLGLGTIATQAASSVTITGGSVTGITDITVADGGTGASTASNARTNLGAAASGANSDITSLSGLTTALSVAQGGTGITSFGSGVATFLGTPSSANLLAAVTDETGTGALVFANSPTLVTPALGTPASGNFSTGTFTWPTFNQNTTGTAAGLSATLAIASGGTGATTAGGALTSLGAYAASNPSGYTTNTGTVTSVGGTGTVNGLTLTGTVTTSGNLTLGGTLSGVSLTSQVSGTLPTANGGTNLTSFTSGGVVYASSTSALATGSNLYFDATNLGVGTNNPQRRLHVKGGGALTQFESTTSSCSLYIGDSTSSVVDNQGIAVTGNNLFLFTSGVEKLRITSAGDVGIGTSSPNGKLEVASAASGETVGLFLADATNNTVYVGRLSTTAGSGSSFVVRGRQGSAVFTANSDANNVKTSTTLGVGNATPGDGAGITFPATQSASSNANTLDDYEEGTWTPSVGGTATYYANGNVGTYTKIGNVVTFKGLLYILSIGTGSTTQITGLPFTNAGLTGGAVCAAPHFSASATAISSANLNVATTTIYVYSNVGNTTSNQTANAFFQTGTYLEFSGTYQI